MRFLNPWAKTSLTCTFHSTSTITFSKTGHNLRDITFFSPLGATQTWIYIHIASNRKSQLRPILHKHYKSGSAITSFKTSKSLLQARATGAKVITQSVEVSSAHNFCGRSDMKGTLRGVCVCVAVCVEEDLCVPAPLIGLCKRLTVKVWKCDR